MKSIYFHSRFWNSSSVLELNANDKLVYAYLITNENTKPSGIYKLINHDCSSRTGLRLKQVESSLKKLHEKKLALVFKNWIFVTRFLEETFNLNKKKLSPLIKKAIERQFKEEEIPLGLIACFHSLYNTLSIPYRYPIDTILDFRLEILDFRLEREELSNRDPELDFSVGSKNEELLNLTSPKNSGKRPESSSNPGSNPLIQKFMDIVKKYPKEFELKKSEDLQWLKDQAINSPKFTSLDLGCEIDGWGTWLEQQYRKREKRKSSRFPKDFKRSFLNRLKKSLEWKQEKSNEKNHGNSKGKPKTLSGCTKQAKPEFC